MPRAGRFVAAAIVSIAAVVACEPAAAQTPDGKDVFARACSRCHTGAPDARATAPDVLARRSPEGILAALTAGSMRPQGGRLTGAERRAAAEFLTGRTLGGDLSGASVGRCATTPPFVVSPGGARWSGWSPTNANARFQPASSATNRGLLSTTDWSTFNGKQNALGYTPVPETRNLTINGTTYNLSADRTWTISAGSSLTIKDEGSTLTTAATSIDFTGAGVTASAVGNDVTVNITGGGGGTSATSNLFTYYNFI